MNSMNEFQESFLPNPDQGTEAEPEVKDDYAIHFNDLLKIKMYHHVIITSNIKGTSL